MWLQEQYPFAFGSGNWNSKSARKYAEYENRRQWRDTYTRLLSIVISLIKANGMPETCSPRFFEMLLHFHGFACIVDDPHLGFCSLACMPAGNQNLYYENSKYRAYSVSYQDTDFHNVTRYNQHMTDYMRSGEALPLGVVFFDNAMQYPMHETVRIYTDKIIETQRTIDVVSKQFKIPSVMETDEAGLRSAEKAFRDVDQNTHVIFAGKKTANSLKESKIMSTGLNPDNLTALWDHQNNVDSRFLTAFGVQNLNTADKKERLNVPEVQSNDEFTKINIMHRVEQRNEAAEIFNSTFSPKQPLSFELRYEAMEQLEQFLEGEGVKDEI